MCCFSRLCDQKQTVANPTDGHPGLWYSSPGDEAKIIMGHHTEPTDFIRATMQNYLFLQSKNPGVHSLSYKRLSTVLLTLVLLLVLPITALAADPKLPLDEAKKKVPAFNFKGTTLDGKTITMSSLKGKVVFLNFWATWCVPCRLEMPAMEKLHQAMKDDAFIMVAVNISEPKVLVKKFVSDLGITFPVVMDPEGKISESYMAVNLPLTYVIDKKGLIVRRAIGPRDWDGVASLTLFKQLAAE